MTDLSPGDRASRTSDASARRDKQQGAASTRQSDCGKNRRDTRCATAAVGVLYAGGRWTGTPPMLPGWVASAAELDDVLDMVAGELTQQFGEPVNVWVMHVPA